MPSFAGGVVIDVELAEKLSKHPNIIGMKDSSGNINQIIQIVEKTKENNFNMVAGTGSLFYEGLLYGCSGGIVRSFSSYLLSLLLLLLLLLLLIFKLLFKLLSLLLLLIMSNNNNCNII